MADAKARSADIPNFDTYPATPPERQLPREGVTDTPLAQSAEQLGSTLGRAVNMVRDLPNRIVSMKERATGGGRDLSATAEEWKNNAQRRVADAQQRARRIVRENPLQALAVVAGIGFLLGVAIRIWRSDRD